MSANAAGGMVGATASEAYQASYYGQMLKLLACDPNVRVLNIFHLVDEPGLAGWQSGLYWFAGRRPWPSSRRQSSAAGPRRPAATARASRFRGSRRTRTTASSTK